ncbi:uncharacterized protein LOC142775156 [Rhipicephalus microplus]|uniref:uncharacterized protein LOC142775156 n=1 Tax=Rhipicephalus microplus TaxID=6941 RepID=UPI003F6BB80D
MPPNFDNMHLVSFMLCVEKVADRVVLNRLTRYLEDKGLYPQTTSGFRDKLLTKDAMMLLKHQVIDCNTRHIRAILGLDLEKALDNATHSFELWSIAELGLEAPFYEYVKSFLTRRRATVRAGDLVFEEIGLGSRRTPQGRGHKPENWQLISKSDVKLYTGDGGAIPRVDSIRVLGMTIESNGFNGKTILKLAAKMDNVV